MAKQMIQEYIQINRVLRTILYKAWDGLDAWMLEGESYTTKTIAAYIRRDVRDLERIWPKGLSKEELRELKKNAEKCNWEGLRAIIENDIPKIEEVTDEFFSSKAAQTVPANIVDLLHPRIVKSSYAQFRSAHFRDSVFNAFVAVFDLIREKTKIDKDGADLVCEVFSLTNPRLVFSSLEKESGRNEQKGFLQILQGAYLGVRNPKAHTLESDLNEFKTIQYLIFASLLARRVEQANKPTKKKTKKMTQEK